MTPLPITVQAGTSQFIETIRPGEGAFGSGVVSVIFVGGFRIVFRAACAVAACDAAEPPAVAVFPVDPPPPPPLPLLLHAAIVRLSRAETATPSTRSFGFFVEFIV